MLHVQLLYEGTGETILCQAVTHTVQYAMYFFYAEVLKCHALLAEKGGGGNCPHGPPMDPPLLQQVVADSCQVASIHPTHLI